MMSLTDQLTQLLSAERSALFSGDLKTLDTLVEKKAALTKALEQEPPDRATLAAIHDTLDDHGKLLHAAQNGVLDVLERLKAQRRARTQLRTYDETGRNSDIGVSTPATERRV